MAEVEQTLDTHKEIAVTHEEIKQQLTEQKVQLTLSQLFLLVSFVRGTKVIYYFVNRNLRNYSGQKDPCMKRH